MATANINQQPTALNLTGVIGSPFSLVVNVSFSASVSWGDVADYAVIVTDQYGNTVAGGGASVTSPTAYELFISWTGAQTSTISNAQGTRWSLQVSIEGIAGQTLLGGPLLFVPSTYPAASSSTTANLTVNVGTNIIDLSVAVGAGGGVTITSNDDSVVVNTTRDITDLSVVPYVTAASVNAAAVSEAYAFGITQSASIAAIATSEAYADTSAHNASVAAVNTAEAYAFGITQAASVASETYAYGLVGAASVSVEQYALAVAQAASVNAAAVSDPLGSASSASTAAINSSFLTTQAASVAAIVVAENYAITTAQAASVNAVNVSETYSFSITNAASVASETYALNQAASVKALALLSANNLSDVADPGTSRENIRIGILGAVATVATASVSTTAPTNGPWSGASVATGNQILLTAQPDGYDNGPWIWNGPSSSLTRPTDYPTGASVVARVVQVTAGTYANTEWMLSNASTSVVGTSPTAWTQGYSGTYALASETFPWGQAAAAAFVGSGSPVGVVTPSGVGDLYVDDTTPALWQANGLADTDWEQVGAGGGSFPDFTGSGSPEGVQTANFNQWYEDTESGGLTGGLWIMQNPDAPADTGWVQIGGYFQTPATAGLAQIATGTPALVGDGSLGASAVLTDTTAQQGGGAGLYFVGDPTDGGQLVQVYLGGGDVPTVTTEFLPDGKITLPPIATADAPAYVEGGVYYDVTLHKLRVGGAAGWETVTSS